MQTKNEAGSPEWIDPDDAPPLTAAMLENAEVYQGETFVSRGPGRPVTGNAKEQVSLRLDRDVLAKLREGGPGWQTQVNSTLRKALGLDQVVVAPNPGMIAGTILAGRSYPLGGALVGATGAGLGLSDGLRIMRMNAAIGAANIDWVSSVTVEKMVITREAAERIETVKPARERQES